MTRDEATKIIFQRACEIGKSDDFWDKWPSRLSEARDEYLELTSDMPSDRSYGTALNDAAYRADKELLKAIETAAQYAISQWQEVIANVRRKMEEHDSRTAVEQKVAEIGAMAAAEPPKDLVSEE